MPLTKLTTNNPENWIQVYGQIHYSQLISGSLGEVYASIPVIKIPVSFSYPRIAITAHSQDALSRWWFAGRLRQILTFPGTDFIDLNGEDIPIGLKGVKFLSFEFITDYYTLEFEPAYWHREISLQIWEYQGE